MNSHTQTLAAESDHKNWIPLLEMAVREVFELMLGCQLTAPTDGEETSPEYTAMVGLAGQLCGLLSIRCHGNAAALMASKMLGVEPDKVGEQVSDALGEVCNMAAGNFKNKISGLAEGCMLSPPTVVTGSDYTLHSLADSPAIEVRLFFEGMLIVIALQINS
ncbi:MAG: chemotaxis protein CheX [Terriglobales bacterium]